MPIFLANYAPNQRLNQPTRIEMIKLPFIFAKWLVIATTQNLTRKIIKSTKQLKGSILVTSRLLELWNEHFSLKFGFLRRSFIVLSVPYIFQNFYKGCYGYRSTKKDDYLESFLTTFEASIIIWASWGSINNCLEPKTKPP